MALRIALNRPDLVGGLVLAGASGLIEKSMVSDIQLRPSREWLVRKIGELLAIFCKQITTMSFMYAVIPKNTSSPWSSR